MLVNIKIVIWHFKKKDNFQLLNEMVANSDQTSYQIRF